MTFRWGERLRRQESALAVRRSLSSAARIGILTIVVPGAAVKCLRYESFLRLTISSSEMSGVSARDQSVV